VDRRPNGALASLAARHHSAARGCPGTIHRRRAATRRHAQRRHQALEAAGAGRPHRAGEAGARSSHHTPARAAATRGKLGAQVRAIRDSTSGWVRAALKAPKEGEETMTTSTKTIEVKVERTIPAPPAEVFDAWLNPKIPGTPWNEADKLLLDPKVDGFFYW